MALGQRAEIALTIWPAPDLKIPWLDVRLLPHAARRFELGQVPAGTRDADAVHLQGVGHSRPRR